MALSIILVKAVGVVLLAWTIRSMWKHLKERRRSKKNEQSFTEQVLNNLLLYLWLAFMTVFSTVMIFNN